MVFKKWPKSRNNSTDNIEIDFRLLRAFKERAFDFIKQPDFILSEMFNKLVSSDVSQKIWGDDFDATIKIIFKLHQYRDKTELSASIINDMLFVLNEYKKPAQNYQLSVFHKIESTSPPLNEFINHLEKIYNVLSRDQSSENIQSAALVLKTLLQDQKMLVALPENDKAVFFAVKAIITNLDAVHALLPNSTIVPETELNQKLDAIEKEINLVMSGDNHQTALMVLNGIRHLLTNFDVINTFAKEQPLKLYNLDKPEQNSLPVEEQNGHLPFHLNNYGTDDKLRETLLRIVREYIAAFQLSKEAGHCKEFFDQTTAGFCLDARVRDLGIWVVKFSGLDTLDALMQRYITEYQAYQKIINGIYDVNDSSMTQVEPVLHFIMRYHSKEYYTSSDDVNEVSTDIVRKYLIDIMDYELVQRAIENMCQEKIKPRKHCC